MMIPHAITIHCLALSTMPHLSAFIRAHTEAILAEWETFARALPLAASMDVAALRDHAEAMLKVIAHDLETPQTERHREQKSQGGLDVAASAEMTAASEHGLVRAVSGFSVDHMLAEFRALRASVIKLWRSEQGQTGPSELEELTRFNEAIDQAIAESIARYTRQVETTRDRFFAVLGHDLRTPLGVILSTSQFLLETAELTEAERRLITGMERSGRRMIDLVRDLLDLALTRLGQGIPVRGADMNVGELLHEVVSEVSASNANRQIDIRTSGNLAGTWDKERLAQALSNLVSNAVQHGSRNTPVSVTAHGDAPETVTVSVSNQGPQIPRDQLAGLFDPLKENSNSRDRRHLGLGLYIVDKIVEAHGGRIDVRSSDADGTTFALSLPRHGRDRAARHSLSGVT